MKNKASAITAAAMLLALAAQTVSAAEAVGYNVVTVPANSDALISVPFSQNVEETFTVDTVTGTGITVNEALSASTYDSSYYIRVIDGAGEGLWSTITANGSGGLTIADDLSGYVANGDTFRVYEHHTIGSVFAASLLGVTFESSTQLIILNTAEGINKGGTVYSYQVNGLFGNPAGWYNGFAYADSTVVPPESYLVVRNQESSAIDAVVFGDVLDTSVATILPATTSSDDLTLGLFPVDMKLRQLGLDNTAGQLVVIDNSSSGINKGGTVYTYQPSGLFGNPPGWYDGFTYANEDVIPAGTGIILRRPGSASALSWTMQKPY